MNLRKLNRDLFEPKYIPIVHATISDRGLAIHPIQNRMINFTNEYNRACIVAPRRVGMTTFSFMKIILTDYHSILVVNPNQGMTRQYQLSLIDFIRDNTQYDVIVSDNERVVRIVDGDAVIKVITLRTTSNCDEFYIRSSDLVIVDCANYSEINFPLIYKENVILLCSGESELELDVNYSGIFDTLIINE